MNAPDSSAPLPRMHAIEITTPGPAHVLALRQLPRPHPGTDEVLIRVEAAGLNRPDILQRLGLYNPPPGASPIPGLEVAGTIEQVGTRVANWQPGNPVVALTNGGGYAQFVSVPAGQVLPLPSNASFVQGAALPETFFTVQQTLIDRARLKKGQTVLIHGGAGGIGITAIQLARLKGARPIATISSSTKAAYARKMGAQETINYLEQDFVERARTITGGKGIDIILDIVGADYLDRHLKCIAPGGTIIQLATLGGSRAEISLSRLLMKNVTLFGSTLRPQPSSIKAAIARHLLRDVWPALEEGTLAYPRIRTFSLADAVAAHKALEAPDHFGKIVLAVA
ncbi:MAG TPA: NAD(P)H-quinone oxidoreductase [Devosia sp.]|nr:NAD(P)H-quinone oxidoreductase [Devosia sp.]